MEAIKTIEKTGAATYVKDVMDKVMEAAKGHNMKDYMPDVEKKPKKKVLQPIVINFDVNDLKVMHKLGEGGFGLVKAVKLMKQKQRDNSIDAASTQSSDDEPETRHPFPTGESKFVRQNTTGASIAAKRSPRGDVTLKGQDFEKAPNNVYALKIISKNKILQTQQQEHLFHEIKYMAQLKHQFICQMRGVTQDERNIYILMDYMQHGELMNVLRHHIRMPANLVKFYVAQVLLVFEHMHARDLIYRDLKPENILVQNNGYIKLTDFGFCKKLKPWDRTYTLCGTPEYMAPEVILNVGHGRAADYYTLGILIYELTVGKPPFMDHDTYNVFKMILREKIPFPSGFPSDAKSLIKHLTDHDLSKRFGNLINGTEDIRKHRFFKNVDFKQIEQMKLNPPFVPKPSTKEHMLMKEKGIPFSEVSEVKDDKVCPSIHKTADIFQEWF
jgi:serine/threonine protein kinase